MKTKLSLNTITKYLNYLEELRELNVITSENKKLLTQKHFVSASVFSKAVQLGYFKKMGKHRNVTFITSITKFEPFHVRLICDEIKKSNDTWRNKSKKKKKFIYKFIYLVKNIFKKFK